jgi:phosphoribosylformylglycinamidine synthase
MIGKIAGPAKPVKAGLPSAGLSLFLAGTSAEHMGGSEYVRWKTGLEHGPCPSCDLYHEARLINMLVESNDKGLLTAVQDCGMGGLFVTLAEMVILASKNIGASVDLQKLNPQAAIELFGETAGRVVLAIDPVHEQDFLGLAKSLEVPLHRIGKTSNDNALAVVVSGGTELRFERSELTASYESTTAMRGAASEVPLH